MLDGAEVFRAEAEQGGAVELRVAADVVVLLGGELVAAGVLPSLVGHVLGVDEHGVGVPVVALAGEVVAALEQQDALARGRELPREGSPAGAAADDDDVVVIVGHGHASLVARVSIGEGCPSDRCDAETMKPRCEKAWGKLPIMRFVSVSYSTEKMPT